MNVELRSTTTPLGWFACALSAAVLGFSLPATTVAAPTGGFLAVMNETRNFGDSMNTIEFLDADDPSVPLFSVYVGREPVGSNEWEEPSAITVDPITGDVYVVAFDSGTPGTTDTAGDNIGDLDLLRIPFATLYDHWAANFEGHNVQGEALATGPAPTGVKNSLNLDYVTYANTAGDFNAFHANQVALPGSVSKIGQVARGNGNSFFGFNLEFMNDSTLFLLDDSVGLQTTDEALDDHSLRVVNRVSTSPGLATATTVMPGGGASNYIDGGWNGSMGQASTESWESKLTMKLNMDAVGHSEPRTMAFYDNGAGVRGVWIVDGDFTTTGPAASDAIGFLQLDANNNAIGWRPIAGEGNFMGVSDDPAVDPNSNNGKIHEVFVDTDGSLVLVESGFGDGADGVHAADEEPGVLRVPVNYDNGLGEIELGAWQSKLFLTFGPGSGDKGTDDTGTEFSQHATFDAVNDLVYFFSPDNGGTFNTDLHVLNLTTGLTTSYLDWDDSISLYGDTDSDSVQYFFLGSQGLDGDFNSDGKVDAADYTVWRDGLGSTYTAGDYDTWKANFGNMAPGSGSLAGGSVPEPASVVFVAIGAVGLLLGRRGQRG